MRYEEREDRELVELARAGWSPAFAVLVHRHAPLLVAAFSEETGFAAALDEEAADAATHATFVRAMRELPERDPAAPFDTWLLELAERPRPTAAPPLEARRVDGMWHDLAARWPRGRRPRHVPRAITGVAVAIAAIAVGIAVPVAIIGDRGPDDTALTELRATPLADPTDEDEIDHDVEVPEPLPTFEFPDVDEDSVPAPPPPAPDPDPGPDTGPATGPADDAAPAPAPDPAAPTTEPAPEPAPAPAPADPLGPPSADDTTPGIADPASGTEDPPGAADGDTGDTTSGDVEAPDDPDGGDA
jgi:hypothetical protein